MSERLSCSCYGFCGASEHEAGAHLTCRLADSNLERIRRLLSNLYYQIYRASRGGVAAFNSSLVESTYDREARQNATLTGQERQGDVQLSLA